MIIFGIEAYGDYPVVGITWEQADAFVSGERTTKILIKNLKKDRM